MSRLGKHQATAGLALVALMLAFAWLLVATFARSEPTTEVQQPTVISEVQDTVGSNAAKDPGHIEGRQEQGYPRSVESALPTTAKRTVTVQVLRDDRPAEAGIPLVLKNLGSRSEASLMTDTQGVAVFEDPPPGPSAVIVDSTDRSSTRSDTVADGVAIDEELERQGRAAPTYQLLDVPGHGHTSIELQIATPGAVIGAAIGPFGEPLSLAQVILSFEESSLGRFDRSVRTDSEGAFVFPLVRPGTYRLQLILDSSKPQLDINGQSILDYAAPPRSSIQVRAGETSYCVIALGQGSNEIRGRVVSTAGIGVEGIPVLVYPAAPREPNANEASTHRGTDWNDVVAFVHSNEDGWFAVKGVLPGKYLIQVDPYGSGVGSPPGKTRLADWAPPVEVSVGGVDGLSSPVLIEVQLSVACIITGTLIVPRPDSLRGYLGPASLEVLARPARDPVGVGGKWYPWKATVNSAGVFEIAIEHGSSDSAIDIELCVQHKSSNVAKEVVVSVPATEHFAIPVIAFP